MTTMTTADHTNPTHTYTVIEASTGRVLGTYLHLGWMHFVESQAAKAAGLRPDQVMTVAWR